MPKNFYVVLGVSADADLRQIRSAYRKLVKLCHPDTGAGEPDRFHEIRRAYETLSNDCARKLHDRDLQQEQSPRNAGSLSVAHRREAPALADQVREMFSVVDEFFCGWVPGVFGSGRQPSRQKNLYVELILEPEEAVRGGLYPLKVPVEQTCLDCGGAGYLGDLVCSACRGSGLGVSFHEIEVFVPPNVSDGTNARLALDDIGLPGIELIVLVTVER